MRAIQKCFSDVTLVHFYAQLFQSKDQIRSANFVKCLVQAGAQQRVLKNGDVFCVTWLFPKLFSWM